MNIWKKEYDQIMVPEEMKEKVEQSIMRARQDKKRMKRMRMIKGTVSAAAVLAVMLILPNTSQSVAAAMQQIPVLGTFFKVVTVREYQTENDRYMADVKVPEVVTETMPETVPEEKTGDADAYQEQARKTAEEINLDIQKVTDELIEEFRRDMEEYEEGYQNLLIDSAVLADTERWFSLDLVLYQGAGSGYERHRHYTIDKTTGKRAVLKDFFGEDYVQVISESIKEQMRQRMAENEELVYWIDNEDIPEWNFETIALDQDFYINARGEAVICFDEYEVAPGYMGCVEFIVDVPENIADMPENADK